MVTTKVAYLAIGVDVDGRKHALGCWIQDTEGAKFWQKVVIDLRNRGVQDILIACCDGLTGLPDAIRSIFPDTVVQTCVVHVIRNAMRFVSYKDHGKVTGDARHPTSAPSVEGAELALKEFDAKFGEQYPGAIDTWQLAWNEFVPFKDYPVRYQDRLHDQRDRVDQLPAAKDHQRPRALPRQGCRIELLYLGLRNISSHRGGDSGTGTQGWKVALNTIARLFPGRLPLC